MRQASLGLLKGQKLLNKLSGKETGEKIDTVNAKKRMDAMKDLYTKSFKSATSFLQQEKKEIEKTEAFFATMVEQSKGEANPTLADNYVKLNQLQAEINATAMQCIESLQKEVLPRLQSLDAGLSDCTAKRKAYNDAYLLLEKEQKKGDKANQSLLAELNAKREETESQFLVSIEIAVVRHEQDMAAAIAAFVKTQQIRNERASSLLEAFSLASVPHSETVNIQTNIDL
jgi:hypothetical protein